MTKETIEQIKTLAEKEGYNLTDIRTLISEHNNVKKNTNDCTHTVSMEFYK